MIGPRASHKITIYHPTGNDNRGNPTGVTTENVPCRITFSERQIRAPDGTDKKSTAQIETDHPIEVGDWVTLPGGAKQQVIQRYINTGLGGKETGREAYL
jgi:hypothetical protein